MIEQPRGILFSANGRTLKMATLPMNQSVPIAEIASAFQTRGDARSAYYVGVDMRSPTHDYAKLHYILMHYRAERASARIWMIEVDPIEKELAFSLVRQCLDVDDDMIAADVPVSIVPTRERIAA